MNTNTTMTDAEIFATKIKYFFKHGLPVHVKLRWGFWKNGFVHENGSADFFMLKEFEEGLIPIFYKEIVKVDQYTPDTEKEEVEK